MRFGYVPTGTDNRFLHAFHMDQMATPLVRLMSLEVNGSGHSGRVHMQRLWPSTMNL
ncbi:Uncharacterised protein [Burkholderia cepacia]|uniref:Uncharacterized protein n=1 Tax=Burkholderia cepacia TaxID=292 RepID=A0AAE8NGC7_BURCE|nr:hypothetical protein CSX04_07871 [Burkholderia cepacia]SPV20451.1 Uncharacterised protein [Burkholderia cepacia]